MRRDFWVGRFGMCGVREDVGWGDGLFWREA
jgi:hypothetical protein